MSCAARDSLSSALDTDSLRNGLLRDERVGSRCRDRSDQRVGARSDQRARRHDQGRLRERDQRHVRTRRVDQRSAPHPGAREGGAKRPSD
eukprot:199979-Pleurochrysis_carterae.AAC.1